jgi:hypothetical protein
VTNQPSIEAIPTEYGGITFRSRLEADWAQTLNANGIKWVYEPETITLPSGTVYIPDFWLPELGTWIEVKGTGIPRIEKTIELAKTRACHCEGECSCQWPGGELVIVGRESLGWEPGARGRQPACGYANWETPYGPSAYSATCLHCMRVQWITLRRPWPCRACGRELAKQRLYRAVDRHLRFLESSTGFGGFFARFGLREPLTISDYALLQLEAEDRPDEDLE